MRSKRIRRLEEFGNKIAIARDMETYRLIPRSRLPPCPRTDFTTNRWRDFSQDVEYFARHADPDYFAEAFSDKGFNPPPSWTFVAKPLAQPIPISRSHVADIVFNLDVIAVFLGVLIIWRSCGGAVALLTSGLAVFDFGSFGRIGGKFLQYLRFPFLVAAIVLWARKRPGYSGAMLGVATGLQIFPLFFGLPIVFRGMIELSRRQKKAEWRPIFEVLSRIYCRDTCKLLFRQLGGAWGGCLGRMAEKNLNSPGLSARRDFQYRHGQFHRDGFVEKA